MDYKTSHLTEKIIALLSEIPEDQYVYITGHDYNRLLFLDERFKYWDLQCVKVLYPRQIIQGALRGRKGRLLIDDEDEIPLRELEILLYEKKILEATS